MEIGRGSAAPPKRKSGNFVEQLIAAQNKMQMNNENELQKRQQVTGGIKDILGQVQRQFPEGATPGSTLNIGDNVSANMQLNRELTQDERSDVATANVIEPHFQNIEKMIRAGGLNTSNDFGIGQIGKNIGRTVKQGIVDSGQPLLTGGNKNIESLQSEMNKLKSKLPFDSGGKQLTGTEKALVFKLLNLTGKSDEVALDDLNFAMNLIRERRDLALGGANAAKVDQVNSLDNETDQSNQNDPLGLFS